MHKYKVQFLQQVRLLFPMLAKILLVTGFMIFYDYSLTFFMFMTLFVFFILIDILPTIIVHLQYLLKNWGTTISIDTIEKTIAIINPNNTSKHFICDIKEVDYYTSFIRSTGWFSFGEYRYYKLTFKDDSKFVVTSALVNDIENNIAKLFPVDQDVHERYIALIY